MFMNKSTDAINLSAILLSKSVAENIPVYFRNKEPPIISYEYTHTIASKLFNFASALLNLDITNYLSSPHSCQCETSAWPRNNWPFNGRRECETERTCFQRSQISRVNQDELKCHRKKCSDFLR